MQNRLSNYVLLSFTAQSYHRHMLCDCRPAEAPRDRHAGPDETVTCTLPPALHSHSRNVINNEQNASVQHHGGVRRLLESLASLHAIRQIMNRIVKNINETKQHHVPILIGMPTQGYQQHVVIIIWQISAIKRVTISYPPRGILSSSNDSAISKEVSRVAVKSSPTKPMTQSTFMTIRANSQQEPIIEFQIPANILNILPP